MKVIRAAILASAVLLAAVIGWQVIVAGLADHWATDDPERALEWEPGNPTALLAEARMHLAQNEPGIAADIARTLLSTEPLEGKAFGILSQAAESQGDPAKANVLNGLALHRAPRDVHARAVRIDALLRAQDFPQALEQIDLLLQVSSQQSRVLFPIMARLAETPGFADALSHALIAGRAWRAGMLAVLLSGGSHGAINRVYGNLDHESSLTAEEFDRWLERLMQTGHWDEAYSRWASNIPLLQGAPLPLLYNGRFEAEPSSSGFDWRIGRTRGVTTERESIAGNASSLAMKVSFSGRRVSDIDFEQRLLLAPGAYRLRFRARAEGIFSDKGLQWAIACQGVDAPIAVTQTINGKLDWKSFDTPLRIPEENCPAQRIWLRNLGAAAAGKEVSGDAWFTDFSIERTAIGDP